MFMGLQTKSISTYFIFVQTLAKLFDCRAKQIGYSFFNLLANHLHVYLTLYIDQLYIFICYSRANQAVSCSLISLQTSQCLRFSLLFKPKLNLSIWILGKVDLSIYY